MIQVLCGVPAGSLHSRGEQTRLEHQNMSVKPQRTPRRSQTHHNYQLPQPPPVAPARVARERPESSEDGSDSPSTPSTLSIPSTPSDEVHPQLATPILEPGQDQALELLPKVRLSIRRPPLGPPRRSHSVMDSEPMPHHHRPSTHMTLLDLPGELHFAIFDFLDPIDSTCLGLASRHLYSIHRRLHGTVPLSVRRNGPNELEWAWHQAGASTTAKPVEAPGSANPALAKMRVRGQAYCRKCGITRCELHKHIREWMGTDAEYCSVKHKFGPAAPDGAKEYCYMSKPGDKSRCGRHRVWRSKVVLQ